MLSSRFAVALVAAVPFFTESAHSAIHPVDDFESGSVAESGATSVSMPIPGHWSHAIAPQRELAMSPGNGAATALLQPGLALNDHLHLYVTGTGAFGRLTYSFGSSRDLTFFGAAQQIEMDVRGEAGRQITATVSDGVTAVGVQKTLQTSSVETLVWPVSQWVPSLMTQAASLAFFFPEQQSDFAYQIHDIRIVSGANDVDFVGAFVATQIPPIPSSPLQFDIYDAVSAQPLYLANVRITSAETLAQTVPAADLDWSWSSVAASVAEMSFVWNEPGGVQETDFEISFDVDGAWNTDLFPPDPIFPPDPVQPESILLSLPVALRFGNGAVHGVSDTWLSLDISPDQGGSFVFQNIAVTPNGSSSRVAAGWTDGFTLSFRLAYSGMGSPDDNFPLFTASWRSDWSTQVPTAALGTMPEGSVRLTAAPSITSGGTRIRTARPLDRAAAIDIHDVTGRRVRSLSIPAGSDAVRWDGRDGDGLPSAAGVYFVRLNGHPGPATRVVRVP